MASPSSKLLGSDDDTTSDDGEEHWSAQYRRRLGIGDFPVEMTRGEHWEPPKHGEIKINFSASMPDPTPISRRGNRSSSSKGGISAVARDSSGDLLAIAQGQIRIGDVDKLGLQLYALKAAANLAKKLKDEGKHDGPVVYESGHVLVTCVLHKCCEGEPEAVLASAMPEGLEDVEQWCTTVDGAGLRLLPRDFLELVEQDKINAGLAAPRNQARVAPGGTGGSQCTGTN